MTGRYKAYPEYKASEVDWLENLPSSWQIMKVKFLLKDGSEGIKIGPFGSALKLEDMVESGIRVYGQENVIQKDFTLGKRFISQEKYSDMKVYTAEAGDILVTMMGTSGKCQVVPENADLGIIDSHLLKLRTNSKILPELFRLLVDETQEIKDQIGKQGKGSIMHGLNSSIVKGLELPLPSLEEQERILSFLDHETAKIDTLIAKQEKLIELLKEKRQAVISHAVTKGLNPNVPMKDSGVEWLGEVPEHWSIKQIKHFFILQRGHDLASTQFKQGSYPVYGSNGVIGYHSEYTTKAPSITVGRSGSVGEVNYVKSDFWAHNTSLFLKSSRNGDIKYIYYFLLSMDLKSLAAGSAVGSLDRNNIHSRYMAVPSLVEQQSIVTYLEEQLKRFGLLTEKANDIVKLLKERKTALISAAVTGKIDVRHFVAEQEQPQGVQG
ncbi:restriction endonuclease subunit S [Vibrio cholerae]|nr:restriction endonuclease subunit S [Vibrio cholerae]EGR5485416.1 restriction endonuclease subunit S [Vibrio cholerae]EIE9664652.1 restriction endonuclease subunit S [Vibrio cholerae]HDL9443348.1 restriction endonuclease subunit S [Vibrio cholerae]